MSIQTYSPEYRNEMIPMKKGEGTYVRYDHHKAKLLAALEAAKMDAGLLDVLRKAVFFRFLLTEAAENLRGLMDTDEAEKLKVREFLPDELEGFCDHLAKAEKPLVEYMDRISQ